MKKSYILISLSLITALNAFAQNIELPDVTTVIEGESIKASNDALPDFKDVLNISKGSGPIVPVLPDINTDVEDSKENKIKVNNNKTVYSEISAGGGYPFLFFGSCEVQSTNLKSPFKLSFDYESANGYNGKPLTENYSDSNIFLSFQKKYILDNLSLNFDASYELDSKGLQNKVEEMSEVNKSVLEGFGSVNYAFKNGITLGSDLDFVLYNRYGSSSKKNSLSPWEKKNDFLTLSPNMYFAYSNNGFDIGLGGEYLLDANLFSSLEGHHVNRGAFAFGLKWHNDIVNTYGDVSLVFGSPLENNKVLFPFTIGVDTVFPVYFSNRKVGLTLKGGLQSNYKTVGAIEKEFGYAGLSFVPTEQADWFGKMGINIPLKATFTGTFEAEYRKTAFDNGVWEPVYNGGVNSIYEITKKNHEVLTTDLSLTFTSGIFTIKGGWHANWFDVPQNDVMQKFLIELSLQDLSAKWGASLFSTYSVMEEWSYPDISLEGFFQVTPTVRLNASLDDVITLFTAKERKGNGRYIDRGFSGSVFLKFAL